MKIYAVIDTNVLVSAVLKWNSVPGTIMQLAFSDIIIPIYNDAILKEYRQVLARPKFCFNTEIIKGIVDSVIRHGIFVDGEALNVALPDPKDIVFYEVVMEKRNDEDAYLVTGNIKHFPAEYFIVTPRQMLDIIEDAQLQ